jgi:hypothetical protein
MNSLDQPALCLACSNVAKKTMLQTPVPKNVHDIITSEEIEECVIGYCESANSQAHLLVEVGEDANIVISAIDYSATFHAIPPMRDNQRWLSEARQTLLLLARPSMTGFEPSDHQFFDEILKGISESKKLSNE